MEASSVYFSSCNTGGAVSNNNRTSSVLQPSVALLCCRRPFPYTNYKTPHVHLYYYSKNLHRSNSTNYNLLLGQVPAANRRHRFGLTVGCAKWSEVKQSKEEEEEEEERIMMELEKYVREKCKKKKDVHGGSGGGELGRKEVAELLECLERERLLWERIKEDAPLITMLGLSSSIVAPGFSNTNTNTRTSTPTLRNQQPATLEHNKNEDSSSDS